MEWHLGIGILAGIVQVAATIPYIISILRGTTRPNAVSWVLWVITVGITLAAQLAAGASWSLFILVGATIVNLAVVFLSLSGYGYKEFGRIDLATIVLAVASIAGWLLTSNPLVAIVFAVAADSVAYAPTMAKMYRDPASEQMLYWGALVLADILALVSVTSFTAPNIIFPIAYGVMNGAGCVLLFLRRRTLKTVL